MSACVQVTDLHHTYVSRKKSTQALNGLSFEIASEKITAVVGPNGSGKTTTFKLLSTQLGLQKGEALVAGHSIRSHASKVRQCLGVSFQFPSLDPILTVEENLKIQAALYNLPAAKSAQRIDLMLAAFNIADRRDSPVAELSGGLARRAELAKTLLHQPKILLLDEPTTGLDPRARHEFWQILKKLKRDGMSIVVTTHLMEEADLCDDLIFINKGTLAAHGSPDKLKSEYGKEVLIVEGSDLSAKIDSLKSKLPGADVLLEESKIRVETKNGLEAFDILRAEIGDNLSNISWGKATLSDVYLSKTGEKL